MECWVRKNLVDLSHYSIVPTFQYSKECVYDPHHFDRRQVG